MRWGWGLATLAVALSGCTKLEDRILSDEDATRTSALSEVRSASESSRRSLVPPLIAKIDTTRRVGTPDNKEDLGPALVQQAESTLRAQTIRERALAGLAAIGEPSVAPLADLVADRTQRPWVRADIATTLGDMGDVARSAAPALERAFAESKDERVKVHAAAALVLMGRRDAAFTEELARCHERCEKSLKDYLNRASL